MIDVFCDVIDNYGDAGVCLRLCRDLCLNSKKVRLFTNNLEAVHRISNEKDLSTDNLSISLWPAQSTPYIPSKTVIQAFSTKLPDFIFNQIKMHKSLVINLEYLTAETFAEECHGLPSFSDGYQSYFFFPGFTKKTGGVVIEDKFLNKRSSVKDKNTVSVFTYENKKIKTFIDWLADSQKEFDLLIFEGKALNNFNQIFNEDLSQEKTIKYKNLNINSNCMVSQDRYDDILLSSSLNFVRGEDSIVRAVLCGKPFLWHIYIQDEDAHKVKINAFFDRMNDVCNDKEAVEIFRNITLDYNGYGEYINKIKFNDFYSRWKKICFEFSEYVISNGSLTDSLLNFIQQKL